MNAYAAKRMRGQSSLEFFLTLAAFLVILLAIGDMIQIAYNWMGIQYASNRGIRYTKMLPTAMNSPDKAATIKTKVGSIAASIGIPLDAEGISVTINGESIIVETQHDINISPLADLLLMIGGDHSGTYTLRVREAVRNESL